MTRAGDDIEFFELSPGDEAIPDDRDGDAPPDVIGLGGDQPAPPPDSLRGRLACVGDELRAVPQTVRVLAALCLVVVAIGAYAIGHANGTSPGAAGPVSPAPVPVTSAATVSSAAPSSADARSPFETFGQRGANQALSGQSCRSRTDTVYRPGAPANLVMALLAHIPAAVVDQGSSVVNELGTACAEKVTAHVSATGTQITLTVTAPPADYADTGIATITGQDLTMGQGYEATWITTDGWTVQASAQYGGAAAIAVALGELATDSDVIVRAAG